MDDLSASYGKKKNSNFTEKMYFSVRQCNDKYI